MQQNNSLKWLPAVVLILALGDLPAQNTPMSLAECIDYALANHPDIRVAELQVKDADWQIKENKGTGLPQLKAGVDYQYFIQRPGIPASALFPGGGDEKIAFSALHSLTPNLSLNQLIYSRSYGLALKAAEYYREYSQAGMAVARQKVRYQVVDAYLPALILSETLANLDKNISVLEKLLNETKAVNQAGFAEQLDVDRLELSLSVLRSERSNLVRQQEIVGNVLKFSMGMPVSEPLLLADNMEKLLSQYADTDLNSEINFSNRAEYAQILRGRDLSLLQIDLNTKTWIPTVAAFVQYAPGWQGGFGDDTKWFFIPSALAGLSVSVPIWDGGVTKAKRERARLDLEELDQQKRLLENAITLEVENARKQYVNAQERVGNQRRNLDLAQRIYDTTQKKYKAGVGSSIEINQAEQALYDAQKSLIDATYDFLSAKTAIRKAMGN
jgi:outer membrane protein TolC